MSKKKTKIADLVDETTRLLTGRRVCPKCGKEIKHRNPISCPYCNSEIPKPETKPEPQYVPPKQCPKCQKVYTEEELYCPYCTVGLVEIRFEKKG